MAHMLDSTDTSDDDEQQQQQDAPAKGQQLNGEFCYWNHEGEPGSAGIALTSSPNGQEDGQAVLLNGSKPEGS